MSVTRRRLAGFLSALLVATVVVPLTAQTAWAAPTVSVVSGQIEQLTLNTPGDVWSGGWVRVAGQAVVLPRNLLLDLPANRLSLQQLFAAAPQACRDRGESGLASSDACNVLGVGGFATIQANLSNAGDVIAGDVFIERGRDLVSGAVTYVNMDSGFFRVNGTRGVDAGGTVVRLNDPTGRHTVQQGPGCSAVSLVNCSPDPRFALDADNYTNAFSTGYPMCIPSTVARPFTDTLDVNRNGDTTEQLTAQAKPDGTGDLLCPDTNRNIFNTAADSRLFAPIQAGDQVTVRGNFDTVGGFRFLSAFNTKIGSALSTNSGADQPDYMVLDSMFIDSPGFQRQRIRDQFIGATTEPDSDVVLWSVHRDPVRNQAHEFPLGSVLGCERAAGPLACRRVLGPNTFRIRHDTLFLAGAAKNAKLSACAQLRADLRFVDANFVGANFCPLGGTAAEELAILSPTPREVQARTGRKMADLALPGGPVLKTVDVHAKPATNGQFLAPLGIGLGGIAPPNFAEIDINALSTPTSFDGITWNLDRRLSPNGCVTVCESTPQPLDPFPYSGFDPRAQGGIVNAVPYTDANYTASPLTRVSDRILSYVDSVVNNFNGDSTVLGWPPIDPPAVGAPPPLPPPGSKPLIAAITPATGPENTTVTIDGVGFTGATAVSFGGVPAALFTVASDTQMTATVPVGAVSGTLTVTLPSGAVTSATRFTVIRPAGVTAVSPANGLGGTPITVTGTGFATATGVSVNGGAAAFTVVSDTAIRATVPLDATSGPVVVSNPAGASTTTVNFTVSPPPPAPLLTGFAPSNGSVGTAVTIAGTDLQTTVAVYFGGVPAVSFTAGQTKVIAVVPAGALSGAVSIATAGGSAVSAAFFQVTAPTAPPPAPLITSLAPATGPAGTQITITGSNLANATTVTFGGVPAIFQQVPAGLLAVVPNGAVSGAVVVTTTLGGAGIAPVPFLVTPAPPPSPAPVITEVTPASGVAGTVVTVTGANLAGAAAITVNGTPAPSFTVLSASTVNLLIPAGATTGPIRVQAPNGIATSPVNFIVMGTPAPVAPAITSFTPTIGSPGSTVVITGTHLTGTTAVTVHGTLAKSLTVNSASKITLVVGAGTTTGPIAVQAPGGSAVSAKNFTVAVPTIKTFIPSSGNSGTTVVITGTNLVGATAVTVNGTPARKFTVKSATKISFVVGTGTKAGLVRVTTSGGIGVGKTSFTIKGTAK